MVVGRIWKRSHSHSFLSRCPAATISHWKLRQGCVDRKEEKKMRRKTHTPKISMRCTNCYRLFKYFIPFDQIPPTLWGRHSYSFVVSMRWDSEAERHYIFISLHSQVTASRIELDLQSLRKVTFSPSHRAGKWQRLELNLIFIHELQCSPHMQQVLQLGSPGLSSTNCYLLSIPSTSGCLWAWIFLKPKQPQISPRGSSPATMRHAWGKGRWRVTCQVPPSYEVRSHLKDHFYIKNKIRGIVK